MIFDSKALRVIFSPGEPGLMVATFNELGTPIQGNSFWGDALLRRNNVAAIGFVSNRQWFPQDAMQPAVAAAKALIERGSYQRVVTYGTSMGAYGALKYGAALRADLALAFAPQISIEPAVTTGWDERYHEFHSAPANSGMRVVASDLARRNLVFYDPTASMDTRHAMMIHALGRTAMIPVPFGEHAILKMLAEAQMGRCLISLARSAETPVAAWRRLLRRARARSPHYFTYRHRAMRDRPRLVQAAVRSAAHARDTWPDNPNWNVDLALALVAAGRAAEAAGLIDDAWPFRAEITDFVAYWRLLMQRRDFMRAREMIEERMEREPGSIFLRSTAAVTLEGAGRPNSAYEHLLIAERHASTAWDWNRLAEHYERLGHPEDEARARLRAGR